MLANLSSKEARDLPPAACGPHYYCAPVAQVTFDVFAETLSVLRSGDNRVCRVTDEDHPAVVTLPHVDVLIRGVQQLMEVIQESEHRFRLRAERENLSLECVQPACLDRVELSFGQAPVHAHHPVPQREQSLVSGCESA